MTEAPGTLPGCLLLATIPGTVSVKGLLWEPVQGLNDVVGEHCHAKGPYVLQKEGCILFQKRELVGRRSGRTLLREDSRYIPAPGVWTQLISVVLVP